MKTSPYYCDICKKYFEKKKQLLEHATMVHPGVPILSTKPDETADQSVMDASAEPHFQTIHGQSPPSLPSLSLLSLSLPFLSLPPPIWLPANPDFDLDIDSGYRTNDKSSWQRRGRQSADYHHTSGGWQRARPRLSNSQPVRRRGGDNCPHRVSRPQSSHRRMYLHLLLVIIVYSVWSRRFPSVISSLL